MRDPNGDCGQTGGRQGAVSALVTVGPLGAVPVSLWAFLTVFALFGFGGLQILERGITGI